MRKTRNNLAENLRFDANHGRVQRGNSVRSRFGRCSMAVPAPVGSSSPSLWALVEPRFKTDMRFRVLGRLIVRPVKVGDLVYQGHTSPRSISQRLSSPWDRQMPSWQRPKRDSPTQLRRRNENAP